MLEEHWLPVTDPIYTARYEVSNYGRVRKTRTGKILKGTTPPGRLHSVELRDSNDVCHTYVPVPTLIWLAFRGPIPDGQRVGYSSDSTSDALSNLCLKSGPGSTNPGTRAMHAAHVSALQATSAKEAWDMVFAEQFPETMRFVERMRKNRPDHDALWLNIAAALAPFSRAELGLGEEQEVA